MTEQEIELVATLAGLAVVITLADLAVTLLWHRRRRPEPGGTRQSSPDEVSGPGDELLARLLAIEAASGAGPRREDAWTRPPSTGDPASGRSSS